MMKKILFADDEESIRSICKIIINDKFPDYEVKIFPDGNSLAGRLEKDVSEIILILTDNSMPPGPKGSEIIQKYARTPKFNEIPFVLSYGGNISIGQEAVRNGAFGFIQKPFNIPQFVDILQKAFEKYKK